MPQFPNVPNYYELLDIPVTATPAEIRNGHLHAAARDSSIHHQKLCNEALATLENATTRAQYDDILRDWNKQQLELGTDKTNNAVRTIHDVNDAIEAAEENLNEAEEVIFRAKFTDQKQLQAARGSVHRLCLSANRDASRVRKWSEEVILFCEEAARHVAEFQYLMKAQARNLEIQIRKAEQEARKAAKQAQDLMERARKCETDIDALVGAAPARVNPIRNAGGKFSDFLSWTSNVLELTVKIIKYSVGLTAFLLIAGLILYFIVPLLWS